MLKQITCPKCSGLKRLTVRNYNSTRLTPLIEVYPCKECSGKGIVMISVEKSKL